MVRFVPVCAAAGGHKARARHSAVDGEQGSPANVLRRRARHGR